MLERWSAMEYVCGKQEEFIAALVLVFIDGVPPLTRLATEFNEEKRTTRHRVIKPLKWGEEDLKIRNGWAHDGYLPLVSRQRGHRV